MNKYPGIPELVETFMEEQCADERWITVNEIRDHYRLSRYQSNTVSAFLRRLRFGPFGRFPFVVTRMEFVSCRNPSDPKKYRYFLTTRKPPADTGKRQAFRELQEKSG